MFLYALQHGFVCISGGTIVAAMDLLKERGLSVQQIKVVSIYKHVGCRITYIMLYPVSPWLQICAVAAPPALSKLNEKYPGYQYRKIWLFNLFETWRGLYLTVLVIVCNIPGFMCILELSILKSMKRGKSGWSFESLAFHYWILDFL